jgi:amidophosphoribosyltransferase
VYINQQTALHKEVILKINIMTERIKPLVLEVPLDAELDEIHEECGVFVIAALESVTSRLIEGTKELENRGYHAAGAYVSDGERFIGYKSEGKATEVLTDDVATHIQSQIPNPKIGIGHTRYATQGEGSLPWTDGDYALALNGNVDNAIRVALDSGISFTSHEVTDGEAMAMSLNQVRQESGDLVTALQQEAPKYQGAFSMGFVESGKIFGMRDTHGIRPLSVGKTPDGFVIASETSAMDKVGAEWIRDIAPGEIIEIDSNNLDYGIESHSLPGEADQYFCGMELAYFMKPNSKIGPEENRISIGDFRRLLGRQLAEEFPIDNPDDYLVVGIPASGVPSSEEFAKVQGITYGEDIIKKIVDSRSFQGSDSNERSIITTKKLAIDAELLVKALWNEETQQYRKLILGDDSIIRGNVIEKLVNVLNKRFDELGIDGIGIDVISSFPLVKSGCHLGTASKTKDLLSYNRTKHEMLEFTGVDNLNFISVEGFEQTAAPFIGKICKGCVKLEYPVDPVSEEELIDLRDMLAAA